MPCSPPAHDFCSNHPGVRNTKSLRVTNAVLGWAPASTIAGEAAEAAGLAYAPMEYAQGLASSRNCACQAFTLGRGLAATSRPTLLALLERKGEWLDASWAEVRTMLPILFRLKTGCRTLPHKQILHHSVPASSWEWAITHASGHHVVPAERPNETRVQHTAHVRNQRAKLSPSGDGRALESRNIFLT